MAGFYPHDLGSVSPSEGQHGMTDVHRAGPGGGVPPPAGHMSSQLMMQNPKRHIDSAAKIPAFTKDTNRRMSSIKQVQDLERQLIETRQQLDRIRSRESKMDAMDEYSSDSGPSMGTDLPIIGRSPRRMLKARTPQDLSQARDNLTNFGRGVLKPPVTQAQALNKPPLPPGMELPKLPPRTSADRYVQHYLDRIHRHYPVIHWITFETHYRTAFDDGRLRDLPPENVAVLFAVLACGAVSASDPAILQEAQENLTRAVSTINFWEDDISTNQVIVAFLASLFLAEINRKTASWIWAGSAIRAAQDLGLHVQGGQWSTVEGEMRKRIWYSLYLWDRLLATELGKPMLINDDDADTEYPELLDEERAHLGLLEKATDPSPSMLIISHIHVARLMSPIAKLFRSLCITTELLIRFEGHLKDCLSAFPRVLQLDTDEPIDPRFLSPLISFQNIRLLLHRHNLSPSCSPEQRSQAIEWCIGTARDTAQIVARCLRPDAHIAEAEAESRFAFAATTMLCTHMWRCMLFLLFRPIDDAFFALVRAASIIGTRRAVNLNCGRYLSFCLRGLVEKLEYQPPMPIDQDEEIVVYLSGDLQSSTNSWVWGSAETGTHLSRRQKHGRLKSSQEKSSLTMDPRPSSSWDSTLSPTEQQDWGGWQTVEQGARYLQSLQERQAQTAQSYPHDRPVTILPRIMTSDEPTSAPSQTAQGSSLAPISPSSQSQSSTDTTNAAKSRMTIASLI
ncbi:putative transcriptional regulatory protein [Cyphellophora attinorum]|uniref:Putative transcriptional regulatory protein n=1 Tax=Cyphellophora attinorum TaxID=1664694 RepID=A0A0N1HEF7_9EURO|nr:putative transcriptional regulatory protein [Phialophora attinorum]KPI43792.1 putative transcriptional regulatory protein [Phialophora attinorum]